MIATIQVNGTETVVEIEYHAVAGKRGGRDSFGAPYEPNDQDAIEVLSIIDFETGKRVDCFEESEVQSAIENHLAEQQNDAALRRL